MIKTVNVNIGGYPFIMDENAYSTLRTYLDQIEHHLTPQERQGVLEDVENRIADLFSQNLNQRQQVVSLPIVQEAIKTIGAATEFGEVNSNTNEKEQEKESTPDEKLFGSNFRRSSTNKMLGGVCGGLAPIIKIDPVILRIIVAILAVLSFSAIFWVYIIVWIITPLDDQTVKNNSDED